MSDVTRILNQLQDCADDDVAQQLLPAVYDELRRMAAAKMANEKSGHSLNATGLVHEAYLRLVGNQSFESRRHFFGAAAEAMRRILIDRSRSKNSIKRGGDIHRADIEPGQFVQPARMDEDRLESLSDALERFEAVEPQQAELVKLRYFVGLTIKEAAEILGISTATADRYWAYAKAWLQNEMND